MPDFNDFAKMAMLDLPDDVHENAQRLAKSFEALRDVSADGAEPLVSVLDIQNVLRDDVSEKLFTRDELLANAPEQYDGYFQVPKTLD